MNAAKCPFLGCPWCNLQVQGCRCATACGAAHCGHAVAPIPGSAR